MSKIITSTIKQGRHTSWRWPRLIKHLKCFVVFDNSCIYNHDDGDQWDWNKAVGIKEKFFKPMCNSIMLGWRWNPKLEKIEVVPYVHLDGEVDYEFEILEVDINEAVYFEVTDKSIHYGEYDVSYKRKKWKRNWLIINWFGGQKPSPHPLTLKINMI